MNRLVIGRRGTGKSTLAEFLAREMNRHQIYFDPGDQFKSAQKHVASPKQLRALLEEDQGAPADFNHSDWPASIAYVPPSSKVEKEFDLFAECLWEYTGEHEGAASYVLVIDEAHELQSAQAINDWLARFIRRAPRRERDDQNPIDMIQTTHNPQDLNRLTFSQADEIFIFNMFDKRALKAISEQWGEEVALEVTQLRTPKRGGRDVLVVEAETGQFKVIDDPAEWYVNIRQTPSEPDLEDRTQKNFEEVYGRNDRIYKGEQTVS